MKSQQDVFEQVCIDLAQCIIIGNVKCFGFARDERYKSIYSVQNIKKYLTLKACGKVGGVINCVPPINPL